MCTMVLASSSTNNLLTLYVSQRFVFGIRRSDTLSVRSTVASIRYISGLGSGPMIQFSVHTCVVVPSPTLLIKPFSSNYRPWRMLLQAKEGSDPSPHSMKDPLFKYLLFKTLATSESGFIRMRHAYLASKN